ncbi:phage tail tape measure protein [Kingella sp. (in: b-proteobacteria)]|uniref:phage tail tape measure protein n=1 Tax=Kingella sp. (in: b-proteobacteria) TaxID=2020713 RepID=UPI0026DCFFBA|nr:phage tail tape measure protein [Kingella sp. (in: b-proteobacteria)]MDO4657073.1 phage tail tape measure protein [Kingella sp. (in: b-proteobacteria)]
MADNNLVLRIIMNASDRASGAMNRVRQAASGLSGRLGRLQQAFDRSARNRNNLAQYINQRQAMRQLDQQMQSTQQRINALAQTQRQQGSLTREQQREWARLQRSMQQSQQSYQRLQQSSHDLGNELRAQGISTTRLRESQARLNREHDEAARALERERAALNRLDRARERSQRMSQIGRRALATSGVASVAAMGIGRTLMTPVKAYAETENASTELRMAMMDKTGKVSAQYQAVNDLATRLGDKLPGTTADFKNLMTMLIRQGVSVETILGGTGEAAALLAVQLKKSPEAAAEMAAKLQDATRSTEKEMLSLMDSVQRLFYAGVEDNNILGAFSKLSPALDVTKMKGEAAFKTFGPLIGMLDQAGLSGESAGNALRKVFTLAMDNKKIAKATKGTGIHLDFTNGKGEFGGMEKMYTELAKLQKLNTEQRLKVLKGIFGDDAETLQALNTMISKGQEGYNEFAAKMEAQASLNQRVNEQLATLSNLWDAATGTFSNFLASMGEAIAPELKSVVEWIGEVNQKLSTWAAENPKTANTIMKIAAAAGVVTVAIAGVSLVVAGVMMPLAAMQTSWAMVFNVLSRGAGVFPMIARLLGSVGTALLTFGRVALTFLVSNPFGWALIAVGLIVALWMNWDRVKAGIAAGWNWLKGVLRDNPFIAAFTGPIGLILTMMANWDRLKAGLAAGWNWLKGVFKDNPFIAALSAPIALINTLGAKFDYLIGKIQQAKAAIQNFDMGKAANNTWNKAKSAVGFSRGGYTGHGGVHDVAGVVHKGEVVFNQADVARFGGWQALERLRKTGLAGAVLRRANRYFSDGAMPAPSAATALRAPAQGGNRQPENQVNQSITINIQATAQQSAQDIAAAVRRELERISQAAQRRRHSSLLDVD